MKVTVNKDCKTATCDKGTSYKIKGLVVRKDNGIDAFYEFNTPMCQANISPGFVHQGIDVGGGAIHIK